MEIRATLRPGANGTRGLLKEYGEQLVCVRCRYDRARRKRYKTVELIIEDKYWLPEVRVPAERRVYLRLDCGERELRELVKQAGGYWNPDKKAWSPPWGKVLELGLEQRVLDQDFAFQFQDMHPGVLYMEITYLLPIVGRCAHYVQ